MGTMIFISLIGGIPSLIFSMLVVRAPPQDFEPVVNKFLHAGFYVGASIWIFIALVDFELSNIYGILLGNFIAFWFIIITLLHQQERKK